MRKYERNKKEEKAKKYFKDDINSEFNYLDISGDEYTEFKNNEITLLKYIEELEQKESILDKVTEECRKQMKEYEDSILEIFPQKILKIIEGEKK